MLANVNTLILNRDELRHLAGSLRISQQALAHNIRSRVTFIVTDGGEDISTFSPYNEMLTHVATIEDGRHDPIGAGDMFSGVLFTLLAQGLRLDLSVARAALAASAMCTVRDPYQKLSKGRAALSAGSNLK